MVSDVELRKIPRSLGVTSVLISYFHAIATPNVPWCRNPSSSDQKMADRLATSRTRYTPKTAGECCVFAGFALEPTRGFEPRTCGLRIGSASGLDANCTAFEGQRETPVDRAGGSTAPACPDDVPECPTDIIEAALT